MTWDQVSFLQKKWIKRTAWVLANFFTFSNFALGIVGIVFTFFDYAHYALWYAKILAICGILDFADGKLARISGSKTLAVDIDTIVDALVFGLSPSIFIGYLVGKWNIIAGIVGGLVYLIAAWYRLYRYTKRDPLYVPYFKGLPSPFAAMVIACIIVFEGTPEWAIFIATILISGFMISTIPFPSFKGVPSKFDLFWIISTALIVILFTVFPFKLMLYPTIPLAIYMIIYLIVGPNYAIKLEKKTRSKGNNS